MDHQQVKELEDEIGVAITAVLGHLRSGQLPDPRVIHLMAKAAVTVLEAIEVQHESR